MAHNFCRKTYCMKREMVWSIGICMTLCSTKAKREPPPVKITKLRQIN